MSAISLYCPVHRQTDEILGVIPLLSPNMEVPLKRSQCKECGQRFTRITNTALTHLKTPSADIALILTGVAEGLGIRPASRVFHATPLSVWRWLLRAGVQSEYLADLFFQALSADQIQCDELWTFIIKKPRRRTAQGTDTHPTDAWVWIALIVETRLVVAVHVGRRTQADADAFADQIFRRIDPQRTLFTTDKLTQYKTALLAKLQKLDTESERNKGSTDSPPQMLYGRVVKIREKGRVVKVETELVWGAPEEVRTVLQTLGQNVINTAYWALSPSFRTKFGMWNASI